jgi:chromosome segregation ATPase
LSSAIDVLEQVYESAPKKIRNIEDQIKKLNSHLKSYPQQHSIIKPKIEQAEQQKSRIQDTVNNIKTAINDLKVGIPALEVSYDSAKEKLKDHNYTKLVHAKSLVSDYYTGVKELEKYADSSKS